MKKWIKVGVLDGYRPLAVYKDGFFCIYNGSLYLASFNPRLNPKFLIKIPDIRNIFINIRFKRSYLLQISRSREPCFRSLV